MAGADACKFQFWSSPARLAHRRQSGRQYEEIYAKYQMPEAWLSTLKEECVAAGLKFMATCYLPEDIATVAPHVAHCKVSSFEAGDDAFIDAHYPFCKDRLLIVSTGLQDTKRVMSLRLRRSAARGIGVRVALLHCVSAYPAPVESLHLQQIRHEEFDGFSDHAAAMWSGSGAVAVACGAEILEVHFRLFDTDPKNPDAPHALTPEGLKRYIQHVRLAERAIGDGPFRDPMNAAEDDMRPYKVKAEEKPE